MTQQIHSAPETELAWAAGFFDGEGYVGTSKSGRYLNIRCAIGQSYSPETLYRFLSAVGVGKVVGPFKRANREHGDYWIWRCSGTNQSKAVFDKLLPFLSGPKTEQYYRAVRDNEESRYKPVTECSRGHEYNEANTYVTARGSRSCRACHAANERRRRAYAAKQRALKAAA